MSGAASEPLLKVGVSHSLVIEVRKLLGAHGIVANYSVADPTMYDAALSSLVRTFQTKKGLEVDGVVGPQTWAALRGMGAPPPPQPTIGLTIMPVSPKTDPSPALLTPSNKPPFLLLGAAAAAVVGGLWWLSRRKSSPMGPVMSLLGFGDDKRERALRRIQPVIRRGGSVIEPDDEDVSPEEKRAQARARREAMTEEEREAIREKARARRAAERVAEREEEREAARAAWRAGREREDDVAEQEAALVRAGYSPGEAAMAVRRRVLALNKASTDVLGTTARGQMIVEARLREEAARMVPMPESATRQEQAQVMAERQRMFERMLRVGHGAPAALTQATHRIKHDVSWNVGPSMVVASRKGPGGRAPFTTPRKHEAERAAEEIFRPGVTASIAPPIGPKLVTGQAIVVNADGDLFETDRAYRERMKDEAKRTAIDMNRPVRIEVTGGSRGGRWKAWEYDPRKRGGLRGFGQAPGRRFRDMTTDALLDEPAMLAEDGRCKEAVNALFGRSKLAKTAREVGIMRRAVRIVTARCDREFETAASEVPSIAVSIIGKTGTEHVIPERTIRRIFRAEGEWDAPRIREQDLSVARLLEREARKRRGTHGEPAIFKLTEEAHRFKYPQQAGQALTADVVWESPEGRFYIRPETSTKMTKKGPKTYTTRRKVKLGPKSFVPPHIARGRRYDPAELARGTRVEMEHTNDPRVAQRIAKDHLREDPNYYTKLIAAGL